MTIKNKKIIVFGLGKSGEAVVKYLQKKSAKIFVFDDNEVALNEFVKKYDFCKIENNFSAENIRKYDILVLSPGINSLDIRALIAWANNVKVIGEQELAFYFLKRKNLIAVTGSNGKTTTVSLINNILNNANRKSVSSGNIGSPLIGEIENIDAKTLVVDEISSAQLETIKRFRPKISVITNISENHLDRYKNMQNYINTKQKIFSKQKKSDYTILNYDDSHSEQFVPKIKSKIYYFSTKSVVKGCYIIDEKIYFRDNTVDYICDTKSIKIKGEHNRENVLCAIIVCKLLGVDNTLITKGIESFYGVKHRMQFVKRVRGVDYINDSKSTTVGSLLCAVKCYERIILLLGGSDKGFSYEEIFENDNVKKYIIFGENKQKIFDCAPKITQNEKIILCEDLTQAFKNANKIAKKGYTVLLSPASASFDQYENFEMRGEHFIELVNKL